jgi:hypothetical protein
MNNVFDEDWNEALDRCIDELLSGFVTPEFDRGGSLLVAQPLVTGQLVCHVGHGSRNRRTAGRRNIGLGT